MIVNVGFNGNGRANQMAPRPVAVAQTMSSENLRMHERVMEYRRLISKYKSDINDALRAVESANMAVASYKNDLEAARAEISRLNKELAKFKGDAPQPGKKKWQRQKKDDTAADAVEAEPVPPSDD